MAYHTHHCSAAFCYSVFLTAFLHTWLVLFVLLPFILSAPCPFNATFLYYVFLLLRSASLRTLQSFYTATTTTPIETTTLLFSVPCIYSFCASCACNIHHSSVWAYRGMANIACTRCTEAIYTWYREDKGCCRYWSLLWLLLVKVIHVWRRRRVQQMNNTEEELCSEWTWCTEHKKRKNR